MDFRVWDIHTAWDERGLSLVGPSKQFHRVYEHHRYVYLIEEFELLRRSQENLQHSIHRRTINNIHTQHIERSHTMSLSSQSDPHHTESRRSDRA